MTSTADSTIAALRTGHDELAAVVRGLRDDQLTAPSGAADWDISQVLGHLGSGAEIGRAGLGAALAGQPRPDGDFNRSVWVRWDAMTPEDRAAGFLTSNEALVHAYESLDDGARESLRIDLGFLPAPVAVATAAGMRLSEFAFHSWDVRVGLDPAATVAPEAVVPLLDVVGMLFGWLAKPAVLGGRKAALRVRTTGPDRDFGLLLGDDAVLTEAAPEDPDGVLATPAEAWLRLVVGRLSPQHTPAGVELRGGDVDLADLRQVFPGF